MFKYTGYSYRGLGFNSQHSQLHVTSVQGESDILSGLPGIRYTHGTQKIHEGKHLDTEKNQTNQEAWK